MRIILLTSSLGAGGAERVATTLCNAWAAKGHQVMLLPTYSGGGVSFYDVAGDVELVYLAERANASGNIISSYLGRLRTLRKLVLSWSPDVVVSFLPNVNVATILGTAFSGIPLIICERSDPTSHPAPFVWRFATKALYRFADMLTVQTPAVVNKVKSLYPGVKLIRAIANPLPAGVALRSRKISLGRKTLLSLGRLSSEKQVERIINAFSEVALEFEDWDLNIYGDGPEKDSLVELVEKKSLSGRVLIAGATVSPWDVMAESDAFVLTSEYEGFPNALLEAMGVGLPCITFDCPSGPREISEDGQTALLVPLNDQKCLTAAMRRLFADGLLREALAGRARTSVTARFGLETVLCQWDELFKEVGALS